MIISLKAFDSPLLWKKYRPHFFFAMGFVLLWPGFLWAQPRNLMVDAAQVTGLIRSFQGVNCFPFPPTVWNLLF